MPPISYKEAKTLLKCSFRNSWKKNKGYQSKSDNINKLVKLNRPSQVTIFRLRTGHCRLSKHIKKTGSCWNSFMPVWCWGTDALPYPAELPKPERGPPDVHADRNQLQRQAMGQHRGPKKDGAVRHCIETSSLKRPYRRWNA